MKKKDVSLIRNEELRPWTVNPNLDGRLKMEKDALERTITYIAPNMSAGKLGSSVLDGDIPGVQEFRTTLMKKTSSTPFVTKLAPMTEFFPLYVTKSNLHTRLASTKQVSGQSSRQISKPPSSNNSGARFYLTDNNYAASNQNQTSELNSTWPKSYETKTQFPSEDSVFGLVGLDSLVEEEDIRKIDTLQRAICRQEKIRRARAATSIRSVRLGRSISPATISMRYTEYQRLRNEMENSSSGKQL